MYYYSYYVYVLVLYGLREFLRSAGYLVYTPEEQMLKFLNQNSVWVREEVIEKEFAKYYGKSKKETREIIKQLLLKKKLHEMMKEGPEEVYLLYCLSTTSFV